MIKGASATVKDKNDKTPIDYAKELDGEGVAKKILGILEGQANKGNALTGSKPMH